ncbi:thymidine kinase [Clostridium botulinum]
MAKLYFKWSCMGAGKSIDLLKTAYNYEERCQKVWLLTSSIDDRYGKGKITTRIGLSRNALMIHKRDNILNIYEDIFIDKFPDVILCDEVQFFQSYHIDELAKIVDKYNINVICYGLRTDFKSNLFSASKRLMEIADKIEELKTMCHCGNKATQNARIQNDKVIYDGEQIQIGGNESYIALCRNCWKSGIIK